MNNSPNLAQLKNQAKDLLRAVRADDPLARKRVTLQLPQFARPSGSGTRSFLLADALFVVARENGFPSWPKLKSSMETEQAMGTDVFSGESGSGWRKHLVERLVLRAADRAGCRDIEGLVECISAIPVRTFLSMRALIMERGDYLIVVDALIAGLNDSDPSVRYACAGAMDHFADDRCVEPLRQLLDDPVPRVRRMALHALSCDACKVTPLRTNDDFVAMAIERATTDPSINVRRHAAAELAARWADPRALQTLQRLLAQETDPAIRRSARWAVHHDGMRTVPPRWEERPVN